MKGACRLRLSSLPMNIADETDLRCTPEVGMRWESKGADVIRNELLVMDVASTTSPQLQNLRQDSWGVRQVFV